MLKRFSQWIHKNPLKTDIKTQRKKAVKDCISNLGFNWCDLENLLFWKDQRISLLVYVIFTAIFWKFLPHKTQKAAVLVIISITPTLVQEIRSQLQQYLTENLHFEIKEENKKLGFDLDDVCEVSAVVWTNTDNHYNYLLQMKNEQNPLLIFILVGYAAFVILIFQHVPVLHILFITGTVFYFIPILSYIGLFEKLVQKLEKLSQPIIEHWSHNQTKRKRNQLRKVDRADTSTDSDDVENEQFLPEKTKYNDKMLTSAILTANDDSMTESYDEFDLRTKLKSHNTFEESNSSDFDESSFLPSYNADPSHQMPSLSQFDSLMEPLDDEFHAGLDFKNVTARSVSEFGIPSNYQNRSFAENDTDEDIDDIPIEQTDGYQLTSEITTNHFSIDNDGDVSIGAEKDISRDDQDYEFLDRTELNNVTDEEINEQVSQQQQTTGSSISKGVSNLLGY